MASREVTIEHKDGRVYKIMESGFDQVDRGGGKTYKELGFKIVSMGDGSPYEPVDRPARGSRRTAKTSRAEETKREEVAADADADMPAEEPEAE